MKILEENTLNVSGQNSDSSLISNTCNLNKNFIIELLSGGDYIFKNQVILNFFHDNFPYFWGGKDICTTEEKIIENGNSIEIKVKINRSHFPNSDNFLINSFFLKLLHVSTRSCFAQSGVYLIGKPLIYEEQIISLNNGKDIEISIRIFNAGKANIKILEGEGLFRFYGINRIKNTVRGEDLYNLIKDGEFKIDGSYGKTWQMMDINGNLLKEENISKSERLILFLSKNKYQPLTEGVVQVSSKKDLEKVLVSSENIPENGRLLFEIGETTNVELGENVVGVIEECGYDNGSRHISSPLIDPLFKGPIRTEIIGGRDNMNNFIELMILKK